MTSRLELFQLRLPENLPEKIEVPVIQVQYHSFMDFYDFGIHYGLASSLNPLMLSRKGQYFEYNNPNVPNIQFSLDPHFGRQPALELPYSQVWGGVGLGGGAYQKAKATSYIPTQDKSSEEGLPKSTSSRGLTLFLDPFHTAYIARDIDETTVQEVVDALAGNRLQPPNWKLKESAFQIDERDRPLLVAFMLEQLKPYV